MRCLYTIGTIRILLACTVWPAFGRTPGAGNVAGQRQSLSFIENIGQVTDQFFQPRNDIDVKVKGGNGLNIFIGNGRIHYQWAVAMASTSSATGGVPEPVEGGEVTMYRMDVELINASPNARIITEGRAPQYERYYTNGLEGAVAHKYNCITYKDIYPNIDWVFYFTKDGLLEYDFVVHPGGKVSDIKIKYSGADDLKLNADGSLTAVTPMGTVTENAPIAYQHKNRKNVPSHFVLNDNVLSFSTADYTGALVIDPVLEWATYFGDSEYDAGAVICSWRV